LSLLVTVELEADAVAGRRLCDFLTRRGLSDNNGGTGANIKLIPSTNGVENVEVIIMRTVVLLELTDTDSDLRRGELLKPNSGGVVNGGSSVGAMVDGDEAVRRNKVEVKSDINALGGRLGPRREADLSVVRISDGEAGSIFVDSEEGSGSTGVRVILGTFGAHLDLVGKDVLNPDTGTSGLRSVGESGVDVHVGAEGGSEVDVRALAGAGSIDSDGSVNGEELVGVGEPVVVEVAVMSLVVVTSLGNTGTESGGSDGSHPVGDGIMLSRFSAVVHGDYDIGDRSEINTKRNIGTVDSIESSNGVHSMGMEGRDGGGEARNREEGENKAGVHDEKYKQIVLKNRIDWSDTIRRRGKEKYPVLF